MNLKPAQIRFHGATNTVTGSCYEIETETSRILVDCGLFQGSKTERELNYGDFPFVPSLIDSVLLTHAHIDHSGLLPKLVARGFRGPIYATSATIDLCSVMLPDSAHIQEWEVETLNRRNARRGLPTVTPTYTRDDAARCQEHFRSADYTSTIAVTPDIKARFWNAGHLLGSASIELEIATHGKDEPMRLLFSGDIGPDHKLLQPEPQGPRNLDYVICESTYGDRERPDSSPAERRRLLKAEVEAAVDNRGALIIPSFAVERTQELLVDLFTLMRDGAMPTAPIFIDSPLATRASEIFARHAEEIDHGDMLKAALTSPHVRFTESVEQSKAINRLDGFFIVIAASGMCDAGRIRHHLKNHLWRGNSTILLVGFQAQGSLGRILLEGAESVRIQGEEIRVRAQIRQLDLYSGHADATEIIAWLGDRRPIGAAIFLTHGEEAAIVALNNRLMKANLAQQIIIPQLDALYAIDKGGAHRIQTNEPRRLHPDKLARLDWHNDLSKLLLDINEAVRHAGDEKARAKIIRRLHRTLEHPERTASSSD